jgi:alkanesulfonate monooxygenase SsuD/methylene tetrahydromethanopterin reductase-like flavin-dependent oxidoreductase (luciferase family)
MIFDVEINSAAHYPAADVPGLIELAEQVGFGAFWKGESNSTDPFVMLSAVASRTKKIKLGTAIYHIYGRSPVTLGIQSATLQDLSPAGMAAFSIDRSSARANISTWCVKSPPASA